MGVFPQTSLNELITMMSAQDRELLTQLAPELMKSVIIDGSDLLAQLRAKGALTDQQKECIKVIKQYSICHLLGPFLFKADKARFFFTLHAGLFHTQNRKK